MIESLLIVAQQVAILFVLMAVGAACRWTNLLSEAVVRGMVNLLLFVVTPCLIARAFVRPFESDLFAGLGWAVAAAAGAHVLGVLASYLVRVRDVSRERSLRFAVIFSNAGFMGIPLQQALLGAEGVFYGAVYVVLFNLFCWSYGLVLMCGSLRNVKVRTLFVNPGSVGIVCGLPFFLLSWSLPTVVDEPLRMISDLNTPVAMIVTGWYLASSSFRPVLTCPAAWLAGGLRLIVIPCVMAGVMVWIRPAASEMALAMVVASSAPVAAMTTMFSAQYGRDVSISAGLVSVTTLLAILTMPPIVGLARWLLMCP